MRPIFIYPVLFVCSVVFPTKASDLADSLEAVLQKTTSEEQKVQLLSNLAQHYYQNKAYRKAAPKYKAVLRWSKRLNDSSRIHDAYYQLGVIYLYLNKSDSSLYYYNKALPFYKKRNDNHKIGAIYNNMSIVSQRASRFPKALAYAKKCLSARKKTGNPKEIGHGHLQLASAYDDLGKFPEALEHNIKAIEKYKESDFISGLINAQNNLALLYEAMDRPKDQIKALRQNLALIIQHDDKQHLSQAHTHLANAYKRGKQYDKSAAHYEKALAIAQEEENDYSKGLALYNHGDLHLKMGAPTKAVQFFSRANRLFNKINFKKGQLHVKMGMGRALSALSAYRESVSHYKEALKMAQTLHTIKVYPSIYKGLADAYKALGQDRLRAENLEQYIIYKDSLLKQSKQKEMTRLEARYQAEKKQLKIKNLEKEKDLKDAQLKKKAAEAQRQNLQKTLFAGGFLGMLVLAFLIYRGYKRKQKDNAIISQQKLLVETKNKEIYDSINYAKRIQSAILPSRKLFDQNLPNSFIFYRPKEVVSGDFYWIIPPEQLPGKQDSTLFAAADCTGHGVPGAMVSVMCSNALTKTVRELGITEPARILDKSAALVEKRFESSDKEVKDGMDTALVKVTPGSSTSKSYTLEFAGAHNPLYIIRSEDRAPLASDHGRQLTGQGHVLYEIRPDKQPVGKFEQRQPFTNHRITVEKGDLLYVFSDGFPDQFGGPKGKKFMYKSFKKLLLKHAQKPMDRQKQAITERFDQWKGNQEQVDDVCVIGVRV